MKLATACVLLLTVLLPVACSDSGAPVAPPAGNNPTLVTTPLVLAVPAQSTDAFPHPLDLDLAPGDGKQEPVFVLNGSHSTLDRYDSAGNLLESVPLGFYASAMAVDDIGNIHFLSYGSIKTWSHGDLVDAFSIPKGTSNNQDFSGLSGIAYASATGNIYTMEWISSRLQDPDAAAQILELGSTGRVLGIWGSKTVGFDLDHAGHLVALNPEHRALEVYDLSGTLRISYSLPAEFAGPGVALGVGGNRAILSGIAGLLILDLRDGATIRSGLDPDGLPYLASPRSVLSLPDGDILVADGVRGGRIVRFTSRGDYLGPWGPRVPPREFVFPLGIRVLGDGSALIFDDYLGRFVHLSASGVPLGSWGESGYRLNQFWYAHFDVGTDGSVWVLERGPLLTGASRVRHFGVDGRLLGHWDPAPGVFAIDVDGEGHVWLATYQALLCYDAQGRLLRQVQGFYRFPFHGIGGFAVDDLGRVAVVDTGRHGVVLADADGHVLREWTLSNISSSAYDVRMDRQQRVYVTSLAGQSTSIFSTGDDAAFRTSGYVITGLDIDAGGRIWVTTPRGVNIYEAIPSNTAAPRANRGS